MRINQPPVYRAFLFSLVFVFISAFSAIYGFSLARKTQIRVAENQIHVYLDKLNLKSKLELSSLLQSLQVAKNQVSNGMLVKDDPKELNKQVHALIDGTPEIYALSLKRERGITFNMRKNTAGWESYYSNNDSISRKFVTIADTNLNIAFMGDSLVEYSVVNSKAYLDQLSFPYDSIVRHPLHFIPGTSRMPGICYSVRVRDSINTEDVVVTIYMSIERVYNFLTGLKFHDESEIHLFTSKGEVFRSKDQLAETENDSSIKRYLVPIETTRGKPFFGAARKWFSLENKDTLSVFSFKEGGERYCAAVQLSNTMRSGVWVSIIMPVKDLADIITGELKLYFIFTLVLLLLSAVIALIFYRMLKRQTIRLEEMSDNELKQLIDRGESDTVEFKSTIRMNLHANKPGKEIELAWLKSVAAFCNTQGGRILIGVSDSGEILGLQNDRFPNEDKMSLHIQNLIKQHIGLEHTNYIEFKIRVIGDKNFIVVRCHPSPKPVFLKFNDKEQFFVRTGPASIELPVSKALEYINDRNKE